MTFKTAIATLACVGLATGLLGCHHGKEHEEAPPAYLVTSPARQDTEIARSYVAQVRSSQHIELRALERGYVEQIFVDEGQAVTKGQRMFQIMPALFQAELQKAQAEVEFTQIEYNNTKVLTERNVVSPNELALSKAKLDKANAELALAKVHRGFTEIKAPFDGIMDRLHVRLGSLVAEGELLTSLSDNSKMWVYFNVTEAEYLEYKARVESGEQATVKLVMANGKLFPETGVVETIEADFNNETGTIAFRAGFANPKGLLRHGETGNVLMTKTMKNAMVIPQKATFEILDKQFVYVVDKDGTVRTRQIEVAEELPQVYVVDKGLSDQDTILLEGLRKVKEGDKIATRKQEAREVISHLEVPAQ